MKRILNHKTEYYECENCGSQVGLVNDICHNCNSPLTETVNNKEEKKNFVKHSSGDIKNLSMKYSILKTFKVFLILSIIGSTVYTLDWFNTYLEMPQMAKDVLEHAVWYVIIGCISSIFIMFCLIKMIDFLFDLDKKIE